MVYNLEESGEGFLIGGQERKSLFGCGSVGMKTGVYDSGELDLDVS